MSLRHLPGDVLLQQIELRGTPDKAFVLFHWKACPACRGFMAPGGVVHQAVAQGHHIYAVEADELGLWPMLVPDLDLFPQVALVDGRAGRVLQHTLVGARASTADFEALAARGHLLKARVEGAFPDHPSEAPAPGPSLEAQAYPEPKEEAPAPVPAPAPPTVTRTAIERMRDLSDAARRAMSALSAAARD